MNNTDKQYDKGFRKILQDLGTERPSDQFTGQVMGKIAELEMPAQAESQQNKRTTFFWIGISMLIVLGLSIMYYYDVIILPEQFKPILAPVFEGIFKSFEGIFSSVEVSSTTLVIIAGFVFLVALERILSRLKLTRNIYFSF